MSSLIANKVKTNKSFSFLFFFIVCIILCATVQNYASFTTITTRSLFSSGYNLFESNTCWLFFSHNYWLDDLQITTILFTHNFIQGWLNSYYSAFDLSCPFIVQYTKYNERFWSRMYLFSPIESMQREFEYLSISFSLMLLVVGLLGSCLMYLLVCIFVVCIPSLLN